MVFKTTKNAPLSSATLHILLALAGGDLHGYGIIKEVTRNSDGHYRLGPGTLYDNLKKLMDGGLVADAVTSSSSKRKSASTKGDDRRFYTLTNEGKNALASEVDRLQSVVREARLRLQEVRAGRA
ncbi:MAG TPA: PadR family transcriptional regulator [Acidobacteriaceae bacterium]|jgi:DNA-binding PadR family transcriptional regulator|nr:PadR family transcriptional regulator [Acidobacteriaceae bacterium]